MSKTFTESRNFKQTKGCRWKYQKNDKTIMKYFQ